jgi:hypothetical protein
MYSFYRKFFFVDDSHVCATPCPHCRHEGEDDFQDSLEDELDTFGVKNYTEGFDEGRKKGFREGKTEGKTVKTLEKFYKHYVQKKHLENLNLAQHVESLSESEKFYEEGFEKYADEMRGLHNALAANGDGSVVQTEFTTQGLVLGGVRVELATLQTAHATQGGVLATLQTAYATQGEVLDGVQAELAGVQAELAGVQAELATQGEVLTTLQTAYATQGEVLDGVQAELATQGLQMTSRLQILENLMSSQLPPVTPQG